MTERAGSSAYFDRGWVTYSNRAKVEDLGIDSALIDRHGAVSEEAARAMASAARERARADIGVAITGIAGPGGGTPEKPVGLVFIALSGAAGDRVRRVHFPSDRDRVRYQSTQSALEMIRRGLLGLSPL
jgi:nicotinamide-nucleotide amidase